MAVTSAPGVQRPVVDAITSASSHVGLDPVDHGVIFTRKTANAWEAGLAEGPTIFRNPDGRWGMTYVGYDKALDDPNLNLAHPRVGLAWSNDLVNWKRAQNTPIFDGTGTPGDVDCTVTGPFMWVEDGVYTLIYIGCSEIGFEAGTKRLCTATATSPTGPWTRHGAIISPTGATSGAGAWRGLAIWHPNVVKVGGTYHLFFNASGYGNIADERIGHASATSLTGPWTVDPTELLAKGAPGTWKGTRVTDPCVYQVGDTWYMAHGGIQDNEAQTTRDGLAFTSAEDFPYGWVDHPSNPILEPQYGANTGGGRPFIVNTPAGHFHFFTAQGGSQNGIALAMQDSNVDGPWHYVGGGGDNPLADTMDNAWFPTFESGWSNAMGTYGSDFELCKYRVAAGGRKVEVAGWTLHTGVLALDTSANTPFFIARHAWPPRVRGGSAMTFQAGGGGGDRGGNFRLNSNGGIAYTVGPTTSLSAYCVDTTYPL